MTTITLVRHAESLGNILDQELKHGDFTHCTPELVAIGDANWPLTESGQANALQSGEMIREKISSSFDIIITSPYVRAVETLKYLGYSATDLDPRIREQNLGEFAGQNIATMATLHQEFNKLYPYDVDLHPPGGESIREVYARVANFWDERIGTFQGKQVLIVSHWVPMFLTRCLFSTIPIADFPYVSSIQRKILNCQIDCYTDQSPLGANIEKTLSWHRSFCVEGSGYPWQRL